MATFLTQKDLEEKITDIIFNAKDKLLIFSPYIKLDDYFTRLFSNHIKNPEVHIIIVFGKNEDNKGKSLRKEDFEFFRQFPKISIFYLKDLHAKYYANESEGVITSINLHDYSFRNNIEFGVHSRFNALGSLNPLSDNLDNAAWNTAMEFTKQAEAVFIRRPQIQKKLLGLSKNYVGSENLFDNTDFFTRNTYNKNQAVAKHLDDFPEYVEFGKAQMIEKPVREEVAASTPPSPSKPNYTQQGEWTQNSTRENSYSGNRAYNTAFTAYCIRTGEKIKYNLNHPFTDPAFQSWNRFKNVDYVEKYCHSCGVPHGTTISKPLCDSCYYKSRRY
jgi:hypothetical protein